MARATPPTVDQLRNLQYAANGAADAATVFKTAQDGLKHAQERMRKAAAILRDERANLVAAMEPFQPPAEAAEPAEQPTTGKAPE